ncbi:MAG: hypothetical protein ORN58_04670, partial [Sediminibacterium sp.]|nr:hypothetical protein [Sediminibacterium sp.]
NKYLILILFFTLLIVPNTIILGQKNTPTDSNLINDNDNKFPMYRFHVGLPRGFTFMVEKKIFKNTTFVINTASTLSVNYNISNNNIFSWNSNFLASTEIRYYYNLNARKYKNRTTQHFSGAYLSVEPLFVSNPYFAINSSHLDAPSYYGVLGNIGFQRQNKNNDYFTISLGYGYSPDFSSKNIDFFQFKIGVGKFLDW